MAWWNVILNVVVRRTFLVEAENQDEALKASYRATPVKEDDLREDIAEISQTDAPPSRR